MKTPSYRSILSVLLHTGQLFGRVWEGELSLACLLVTGGAGAGRGNSSTISRLLVTGGAGAESFAVGRGNSSTIS